MNDRLHEELEAIAGPVSRETFDRLRLFEAQFRKWAEHINLAAPSTLGSLWPRHILDSAQILPLAPKAAKCWVDMGTGGGFPGAVLAILLAPGRPEFHLVESNGKKAAFLKTALQQLGLRTHVHRKRIEDVWAEVGDADIVTARALAPLDQLLRLGEPWLAKEAAGLFHKGRDYASEIVESHARWRYDLVIHDDRIDPQGRILQVGHLRRVDISQI